LGYSPRKESIFPEKTGIFQVMGDPLPKVDDPARIVVTAAVACDYIPDNQVYRK
jgi:hypothetical protein